jgi:hypothetical protein
MVHVKTAAVAVAVAAAVTSSTAFTGLTQAAVSQRRASLADHRCCTQAAAPAARAASHRMSSIMGSDSSSSDEPSDLVLQLHQLTDGAGFRWAQAAYAVALLGLIDGGFSGDWAAQGFVSEATEATLRQTVYAASSVHVVMATAAAYIASQKGENPAVVFAAGLATGAMELLRTLGLVDDKEKAAMQKNKNTNEGAFRSFSHCVLQSTLVLLVAIAALQWL